MKKGDQPEELGLDKMMQIANFMREFMREGAAHGGAGGAAPSPAPAATVPEGFINFAGEVIPGLELLDAAIKSEGGDVAKALGAPAASIRNPRANSAEKGRMDQLPLRSGPVKAPDMRPHALRCALKRQVLTTAEP